MNNCNCQPQSSRPAVPTPYTKQFACNLYEPDQALRNGTVFQDLNKPFHGSMKGGRF